MKHEMRGEFTITIDWNSVAILIVLLSPDDTVSLSTPHCTSGFHRPQNHKHEFTDSPRKSNPAYQVLALVNQRMKNEPISFCLALYHPRKSFSSFLTQCWSMHFCLEEIPIAIPVSTASSVEIANTVKEFFSF